MEIIQDMAKDFSRSSLIEIQKACEHRSMLLWNAYTSETNIDRKKDLRDAWKAYDDLAESISIVLTMQDTGHA